VAELWRAVFNMTPEEALTLDEWLGRRLKEPCTHHRYEGRIVIEGPTRDDVFKTSEWVRNQNPLGRKLNYSVIGYDENGKIAWLSYCKLCREQKGLTPHSQHSI